MVRISCILALLLFGMQQLLAQIAAQDTTFRLPTLEVGATRLLTADPARKQLTMDSLPALRAHYASLSEVIQTQGQFFIKNYGPGRLATSSIRGAGAVHTAVLWNGFSINSPMLGQTDLSLLPLLMTDAVQLQYGGGGVQWGSGAVGGVLQLQNTPAFNKPLQLSLQQEIGSYGLFRSGMKATFGKEQLAGDVRVQYRQAENDFSYRNLFDEKRTLTNAELQQWDLALNQYFRKEKQQISLHGWFQQSEREIPPTRVQERSVAVQDDKALRLAADWKLTGNRLQWNVRAAWLHEQLAYQDSLARIDSDSRSHGLIGEAIGKRYWQKGGQLHFGLRFRYNQASSRSYRSDAEQCLLALWAEQRGQLAGFSYRLGLRQSFTDGTAQPLLPELGLHKSVTPTLEIRAQAQRIYREPSLDDLYWEPGGNPNLQPERGWAQEVGLNWQHEFPLWELKAGATAYSRQMQDWILWRPGSSFWFPQNVQDVWSRGLELDAKANRTFDRWQLRLQLNGQYVRSTDETSNGDNEGRQLIYVPELQASASMGAGTERWTITYQHLFNDQVYTLPDHSEHLPAWQSADVLLRYRFRLSNNPLQLSFTAHNIWNETYVTVVNRPLPGRNYRLSIQFQIL